MNPRKDFNPFVPVEDWYENYWLRPGPVKQSTSFRRPRGVMAMVHRATQLAFQWSAWVQRRDKVAPEANQILTSSALHGARRHGRGETRAFPP
jgi:hypothetical protein